MGAALEHGEHVLVRAFGRHQGTEDLHEAGRETDPLQRSGGLGATELPLPPDPLQHHTYVYAGMRAVQVQPARQQFGRFAPPHAGAD